VLRPQVIRKRRARLPVLREAALASEIRMGATEFKLLDTRDNIAQVYGTLGRHYEALALRREIHAKSMTFPTAVHAETKFLRILNLSASLIETGHYKEAKDLAREWLPKAKRTLGADSGNYGKLLLWNYAKGLCDDPSASRDDITEAAGIYDEELRRARRTYGPRHPYTEGLQRDVIRAGSKLARAFDAPWQCINTTRIMLKQARAPRRTRANRAAWPPCRRRARRAPSPPPSPPTVLSTRGRATPSRPSAPGPSARNSCSGVRGT